MEGWPPPWSPGRFGRDKDGLSWKVQRRLAWERDKFTCQECGKHKDGWKPDVHHISPFRVSQSHALENLRCLCKKCHRNEDARVQALWSPVSNVLLPRGAKRCGCGRTCRGTACWVCRRKETERMAAAAKREITPMCSCGRGKPLGVRDLCMCCWSPILLELCKTPTMRSVAGSQQLSYHTVDMVIHPRGNYVQRLKGVGGDVPVS